LLAPWAVTASPNRREKPPLSQITIGDPRYEDVTAKTGDADEAAMRSIAAAMRDTAATASDHAAEVKQAARSCGRMTFVADTGALQSRVEVTAKPRPLWLSVANIGSGILVMLADIDAGNVVLQRRTERSGVAGCCRCCWVLGLTLRFQYYLSLPRVLTSAGHAVGDPVLEDNDNGNDKQGNLCPRSCGEVEARRADGGGSNRSRVQHAALYVANDLQR
jgi:hypothetical protein